MKKLFAITLSLVMALSLAACGAKEAVQDAVRDAVGGDTSGAAKRGESTAQDSAQDGDITAATPGTTADTGTVEGRLAKAGLTLEAIMPESFAEASLYNCDADEIVMYLTNDGSSALGAAVMQPMVEKILTATAAASDDGQNYEAYYGLGDPRELDLSDTNYDAYYFIGQWSYKVGGQWITVTLGVLNAEEPEGEDNYDWEVTMAFLY